MAAAIVEGRVEGAMRNVDFVGRGKWMVGKTIAVLGVAFCS